MEQPALLSPCTPRGADLFLPAEYEAPFANVAFNPRHRRALCTRFPGRSKASSHPCPPAQRAPAPCPKATALSRLVTTARRAPRQQQPGGTARTRPVPEMKQAESRQKTRPSHRVPADTRLCSAPCEAQQELPANKQDQPRVSGSSA